MSIWLYQLNQKRWSPEVFRYEIWENQQWCWESGNKKGKTVPKLGDVLIFFYAETTGPAPGFYAWAVLERFDAESKTLYFVPSAPTNHLKMDPWWDPGGEAKKTADEIRGAVKRFTLFEMSGDSMNKVRAGIKKWLGSGG